MDTLNDSREQFLSILYSLGFEKPDLRAVLIALKWLQSDDREEGIVDQIYALIQEDAEVTDSLAQEISEHTSADYDRCERLAALVIQRMDRSWVEWIVAVYLGVYSNLSASSADLFSIPPKELLGEILSSLTPEYLEETVDFLEGKTTELSSKPNPSPIPFDPATGLADTPSDSFTLANIIGLMRAKGDPSKQREGEWTEDNFGRPVYRYRISGPPWGGMGQLSVVEEVETQQAWKMLEEGDLDAVTLYFLYLAYASDTGRRGGIDEPFRIDKQTVFHALGLHRRTDMSVKEKVKRIIKLNSYLRSFQIQLNRVSYNGERVRTDAISPAYLWDTYVRGLREDDFFGEPQWGNFWIEGREGAWAYEFLHSERGGRQWTALPIRILEDIDRRSEWPRRILFHSLLMFRINRGGFTRKAQELLRWCQCDPSTLGRRKRSRRKKKLLNALDELKELGFQIEDARLRIKGRPFDEWLSERAEIHPPEEMGQKKYLGGNGKPKITAPREEVWTGQQIRALRKHVGETQADFAARFGLKGPMISLWENGHETPKPAHEKTLDNIAREVGFSK